jgi:hypothetical protein
LPNKGQFGTEFPVIFDSCAFPELYPPTVVDHEYTIGDPKVTYQISPFTDNLDNDCAGQMQYVSTVEPAADFIVTGYGPVVTWESVGTIQAGVYTVTLTAEAGCTQEAVSYTVTVLNADGKAPVQCGDINLSINEEHEVFSTEIVYDPET